MNGGGKESSHDEIGVPEEDLRRGGDVGHGTGRHEGKPLGVVSLHLPQCIAASSMCG